ncbi:MAG: lysophospholipid acyltransferase family protein [Phycisphaerae bacterium]
MARPRNNLKDFLAFVVVRLFVMFVHMFGWETNYRAAAWLGNLLYRFDRRHRNRAVEHIRLSFPDWPEDKVRRVAMASMRNLMYLGLEVLFTTRLICPGRWRKHVKLGNMMAETTRLLVERKSGVVMATPHFGNWEVVGYTMATLGFPVVAVARPLDNPYFNEYVMGVREKTGMSILYKKGATQSMDDVIASRGVIGFIPDQDAGRKGVFVDFFGRKASTYKSVALMAIRHNVPLMVGYGQRLDEEYHFEMGMQRIIYPHEWADKPDPLLWVTQEWTTAMEQIVRRAPEQYLWVHRRWKHRPNGEQPGPDGIA